MSIRRQLGLTESNWVDLGKFLSVNYITGQANRRRGAQKRDDLFLDDGDAYLDDLIGKVFQNDEVVRLRKQWIGVAKYDNAAKRIIRELSTVYDEPALRTVLDLASQAHYTELQGLVEQDEVMQQGSELLNLHNDIWIGFRVRKDASEELEPVIDVITPAKFDAIAHPRDATRLLGVLIHLDPDDSGENVPHYVLWTSEEKIPLNASHHVIVDQVRLHGFGSMPGVLAHQRPPRGKLLDDTSGEDIIAAALAAWFENVLLLKESKSANRQMILTGDVTGTATGQTQDSEVDSILGEGVSGSSIERGVDLEMFRQTADHIIERAAANYGIPPAVLRGEGATSGFEISLRRLSLRERRRRQIKRWRTIERQFVQVQSAVIVREMPALAFDTKGWRIDFGEVETPLEPIQQLNYWKALRQMGLGDTLQFVRKINPDLQTDEAAQEWLNRRVENEILRNIAMRPLAAMSGSVDQGVEDLGTSESDAMASARRPNPTDTTLD